MSRLRGALRWVLDRLDVLMVVVAVVLISWAAFDIGPVVGRVVSGIGLLYLGGGIGRFVRELRGG